MNATQRASELLASLRSTGTWTNAQFWEAHFLLGHVRDVDMDDTTIALLFAWGDEESDRIALDEHHPCGPELEEELAARWPAVGAHNGRSWD